QDVGGPGVSQRRSDLFRDGASLPDEQCVSERASNEATLATVVQCGNDTLPHRSPRRGDGAPQRASRRITLLDLHPRDRIADAADTLKEPMSCKVEGVGHRWARQWHQYGGQRNRCSRIGGYVVVAQHNPHPHRSGTALQPFRHEILQDDPPTPAARFDLDDGSGYETGPCALLDKRPLERYRPKLCSSESGDDGERRNPDHEQHQPTPCQPGSETEHDPDAQGGGERRLPFEREIDADAEGDCDGQPKKPTVALLEDILPKRIEPSRPRRAGTAFLLLARRVAVASIDGEIGHVDKGAPSPDLELTVGARRRNHGGRYTLRTITDGFSPHRRRTNRTLQLAVHTSSRRGVS